MVDAVKEHYKAVLKIHISAGREANKCSILPSNNISLYSPELAL